MKKTILLITFILAVLSLTSCIKEEDFIIIKDEDDIEDKSTGKEKISALSGLYAEEEKINRRPVAVMFDNHPKARWQSGLSFAEIVYEFMVEYPYTRYMGIYLINDPELLGPIRSSRPYFITTLLEFDPIYVRVGGSEEAKKDIKSLNIADIDGISNSSEAFWRYGKTGKKGPHNLYTSMNFIRKAQEEKGYSSVGNFKGFNYNREDIDIEGFPAKNILIKYNDKNTTQYIYDKEENIYKRYKDGELHIDEYNEAPIIAKNILIQQVNIEKIDKEGRLSMDLVADGIGIYITGGKGKNITWRKESREDKTYFYDKKGEEIVLNPGVTWIQITNLRPNLTIN